jgi:NAD(P)-dependent dehydrogenase (short-subunit alcohol dehydrogenase family)
VETDCEMLVARTRAAFGRLDIVHSNAGVLLPGSVTEISPQDWRRSLDVNLTGSFHVCRAAIPALLESGGGSIVLTSSVSGLVAEPAIAAYCATKGALIMLAKQMAIDYARSGIRVNAVCPGWIDTPFNDPVIERSGGRAALAPWIETMVPMGRQGTPEEVADVVLFLVSEDARYVTGHALVVDAGLTAH